MGEISLEDGEAFARDIGASFFETSAKTRTNVEESVFELVRTIRKNRKGDNVNLPSIKHKGGEFKPSSPPPPVLVSATSTIGPNLRKYIDSPEFSDFKFICIDGDLLSHKIILCSRSPHLRKIISAGANEMKVVHKKATVLPLLNYFYAGIVDIPQRFAKEALEVAKELQVTKLIPKCEIVVEKGWYPSEIKDLNNRLQELLSDLEYAWRDTTLTDGTIILSDGTRRPVHKIIVGARSEYFRRALAKRDCCVFPEVRPYSWRIRKLLDCMKLNVDFSKKEDQDAGIFKLPSDLWSTILGCLQDRGTQIAHFVKLLGTCKAMYDKISHFLPRELIRVRHTEEIALHFLYSESNTLDDTQLKRLSSMEALLQIHNEVGMPVRFRQLCEYNLAKSLLNQPTPFIWKKIARMCLLYQLNQLYHTVVYCGALCDPVLLEDITELNSERSSELRREIEELRGEWSKEAKKKCVIS
eukprot:TRINITY_DN269_c0_g1_i2.p1 TRINITY_DN269_c0_g1~~TRINITY_DN269_c0_g1_i2.p1  ORF type:complete len:469 (+),score=64.76 TRINITY_DN269_c0_g1_i2:621-2027(+)